MRVWIVMIAPSAGVRYIDTIWATEMAAVARTDDLTSAWTAAGNPGPSGHRVVIYPGKVEDAALVEKPGAAGKPAGNPPEIKSPRSSE